METRVNFKSPFKGINVKNKVKKAQKALKEAGNALADFTKDIDKVTISFGKNKALQQITYSRDGKKHNFEFVGR